MAGYRPTHSGSAKAAVAELQLHLHDGEWDALYAYGEIPEPCGADGYRFTFDRSTRADSGWRLPEGTPEAQAEHLVAWLGQHDWTDIVVRSYTGIVTDVTITARKPDAHVDDLLITLSPGDVADGVSLRTATTCQPGSHQDLADLMFPTGMRDVSSPRTEHPSAEPFFGTAENSPSPGPRPAPLEYPTPTPSSTS